MSTPQINDSDADTLRRLHRATLGQLHREREASSDARTREQLRRAIADETRLLGRLGPSPEPDPPPASRAPQAPRGRRAEALALLAGGAKPGEVARAIGIDPSTLFRWRRGAPLPPPPAAEVLRIEIEQRTSTRVAAASLLASEELRSVAYLIEVRDDKRTAAATRVRAACELLDRAYLRVADPSDADAPPPDDREAAVRMLRELPAELLREALGLEPP